MFSADSLVFTDLTRRSSVPRPNHSVRTVCVAMVRNESDIIRAWLSHVLASFERIFVVDHMSDDGTLECLKDAAAKYPEKLTILQYHDQGYYQKEITNHVAKLASRDFPNAWIIPLDADEFIRGGGAWLTNRLKDIDVDSFLVFQWRNVIPYCVSPDSEFELHGPCLLPKSPSPYTKSGMHASMIRAGWGFIQGNHTIERVLPDDTSERHEKRSEKSTKPPVSSLPPGRQIGDLWHVPLRSLPHFVLKIVQGCLAYEAINAQRCRAGQGGHWFQMLKLAISRGGVNEHHLRYFVSRYGVPDTERLNCTSIYEMIDDGWIVGCLETECEAIVLEMPRRSHLESIRSVASAIRDHEVRSLVSRFLEGERSENRRLVIRDGERFRRVGRHRLSSLNQADVGRALPPNEDVLALSEFLAPTCHLRPNSTAPNIWEFAPFLIGIVRYMQPERYVQLGTKHEDVFLEVCEASGANQDHTECIAVDSWNVIGDAKSIYQLKRLRESVTNEFRECAGILQANFVEAARQFEPSSVNVLLIDCMAPYEELKSIVDAWRGKMSRNGLIAIRFTSNQSADNGAFRLWREWSRDYESVEFAHGDGLGVCRIDPDGNDRLDSLFRCFKNPRILEFISSHFAQSAELAKARRLQHLSSNGNLLNPEGIDSQAYRLARQISRTRQVLAPNGSRRHRAMRKVFHAINLFREKGVVGVMQKVIGMMF